jgi:hypothetical protein
MVKWKSRTEGDDVMNKSSVSFVRCLPIMVAMCSLGSLATSVASAQGDPQVGTWELNLAKSTFSPGPPPQRQTLTYKAEGQGSAVLLLQGVDAAGKPINLEASNLVIIFDGKDHPTPNANYEISAWKRISANKYEVTRKKAGKVVLSSTHVVSKDGKTMTITTTGVDADGHPINNVRVYDKQEAERKSRAGAGGVGRAQLKSDEGRPVSESTEAL